MEDVTGQVLVLVGQHFVSLFLGAYVSRGKGAVRTVTSGSVTLQSVNGDSVVPSQRKYACMGSDGCQACGNPAMN